MVENKKVINSERITEIFGLKSEIYNEIMKSFEKELVNEKDLFLKKYNNWNLLFKNIFGSQIERTLFLKQTYLSQILKILILFKLKNDTDVNQFCDAYKFYNLEEYGLIELKYFNWIEINEQIIKKIYNILNKSDFSNEDLFHEVYQDIFSSKIRHKAGEFYTIPLLVNKMVNDVYKFGMRVLDPSCGSGSFLIQIIISILKSQMPFKDKIDAINNVYGFDVNPLAILTAKSNILLFFLSQFDLKSNSIPKINIFLLDSLFPEDFEKNSSINLKKLYSSFDLAIGNPPWLTYKDINNSNYQKKIRLLAESLNIKPRSQYITHIELASIFFYAIPLKFLKMGGEILFVITKSVLNGDHCFKFRSFSIFENLEIWDFPKNYFFNVDHICLKAKFVGAGKRQSISSKYPINSKIFNDKLELQNTIKYTSIKCEEDGAKIILPEYEVKRLNELRKSPYKEKFLQGATLVPRTLVFFEINDKNNQYLKISSDSDILLRAKKKWKFTFKNVEIENRFRFKSFLNMDLIPFLIKKYRNVFLPINSEFEFKIEFLKKNPKAFIFYNKLNDFYKRNKKSTSNINTLFENLNYWNKLTKQFKNKKYIVVYNASGSNLKAAVINNEKKNIVIDSENYYLSTDSLNEAYYLSAILNSPLLSKSIKLIKSSRHIHKRPFLFNIPLWESENELHRKLAKKSYKYQTIVQDLASNNPNINPDKIRIFLRPKLEKINSFVEEIIFNK
ncbi:MAG: N-6 DNA methylase [Promethearchaeota archaeon]